MKVNEDRKAPARARPTKAKRAYASPLRAKQAEATREAILESLAQRLAEGGLRDFSIPQVAKRAGVTTRTVYRYFPTRDALLDGLDGHVDIVMKEALLAHDVGGMVERTPRIFAAFDANAPLARALLQRGPGSAVRERGRRRRAAIIEAALRKELPALDAAEVRRAAAVIHHASGLSAWDALTGFFGLSGPDAGRAAAWAVETLIEDMRRRNRAAGKDRVRR